MGSWLATIEPQIDSESHFGVNNYMDNEWKASVAERVGTVTQQKFRLKLHGRAELHPIDCASADKVGSADPLNSSLRVLGKISR